MSFQNFMSNKNIYGPQSSYTDVDKILVAIDCIIFGFQEGNLKILLFKRKVAPFEKEWSLIGSFVKVSENIKEASNRILEEITGLKGVYLKELRSYGNVSRDPGARVISIAHYALIKIDQFQLSTSDEFESQWFNMSDMPILILDHKKMVDDALNKLRQKIKTQPIGFELLNEKFTLTELKALYDSIYGYTLDRGNFRKKILGMKILDKMEEKDKANSKKGAFLYKFNEQKYKALLEDGAKVDFF